MKKWFLRGCALVLLIIGGLIGVALSRAYRTEQPVGFEVAQAKDARGRRFPIAIWYPSSDTPQPTALLGLALMSVARDGAIGDKRLPLVVLSHGNGGGPGSHIDLALTLADAGYAVAAPMHHGDNFEDSTGVGEAGFWSGRNRELKATIDYMTTQWRGHDRIDSSRIGAFGFSAGGFTVLTAIGAKPDLQQVRTHCARTPEFACTVLKAAHSSLLNGRVEEIDRDFVTDARIRAAVVAAPGLGFAFADGGLDAVRVPVLLWSGGRDAIVPEASNTAFVRTGLGRYAEPRNEPGAGHYTFLAPCRLLGPPVLCRDEDGFDREAFHREMNAGIRAFFGERLGH